ncbi:MAG: lipoyl(octanoyl) transferase LipB, partial [Paracoccaceae bacterium]|nr:lipoyl(octanoyl) transferase LipB [Paracoccaceae bacterium]
MVEWTTTPGFTDYREAEALMERRAAAIAAGTASESIWLLEHAPLYTAGTSARIEDLTDPDRFPVYPSKRGGQYTYHGPGQRVVYVMLDVGRRGHDVRRFVQQLEAWVIETLAAFGVEGHIREGRVGVWVERPDKPRGPDVGGFACTSAVHALRPARGEGPIAPPEWGGGSWWCGVWST